MLHKKKAGSSNGISKPDPLKAHHLNFSAVRLSDKLVIETYDSHPNFWTELWQRHVSCELAAKARAYISSLLPITIDPRFSKVLEPESRVQVDSTDDVIAKIAGAISASKDFRSKLDFIFSNGDLKPPGGNQLKRIIAGVVTNSVNSIAGSSILTSVTEKEIYPDLANLLSEELYMIGSTQTNPDERLLLNYGLLIYHLRRWTVPFSELRGLLMTLDRGVLGIRGKLISIQNRHPNQVDEDRFSPKVTDLPLGSISLGIKKHSSLFEAIERETNQIAVKSGLFHRLLPTNLPVDPTLLTGAPHRTQELVESGRELIYTQFEHTGVIFMVLTAMEFLLRSYCPEQYPPDHPIEAVIKAHTNLSDDLRDQIISIFSSERLNLRNRCVHGSFLEIEGRRDDLIRASGLLEPFGVRTTDLSTDGSLPEPVSKLAQCTLGALAAELETTGRTSDLSWTKHFLLTEVEETYASHIHCDLLHPESAEIWQKQISDYIDCIAPCLSTPIKMGFVCWRKNNLEPDTLPGFFYLALLFEPLLRLTIHLGGRPVLQAGLSNKNGREQFRLQYRMIDGRGLLSENNKDWLTAHLTGAEKPHALEILRLATKCRDAFAHGAVHRIDSDLMLVYGHTLTKAIQLITEVGRGIIDVHDSRLSSL